MYLGIDVGTSGCKALVADETGKVYKKAYRPYSVVSPQNGWLELDAERVFGQITECLRECCREQTIGSRIEAIAVSSQGEAVIPVSEDGCPLANAIVTFDTRNQMECARFVQTVDVSEVGRVTGAPVHPMFSLTKIMWFQNNRPEIYKKTQKFLCFGDFVSMRLGAEPCIDYTMAARTMAFDIREMEWSKKILSAAGVSSSKLPNAVLSGTIIGQISARMAAETGISENALIVAGAHDQICCALGAGVTGPGVAMDSLGTTESILCVGETAVSSENLLKNAIPCYPYAISGRYAFLTFLSCCGSVLQWLGTDIAGGKRSFREMDEACATLPRPSGLFVLPHFAGSGTPYLDCTSKGVIAGLTLSTKPEEIHLAIMESTAFEMRINIEIMESAGIAIQEYRSIGGGSKSEIWMRIKADITGKPMTVMETEESGCMGACMLAAKGKHDIDLSVLAGEITKVKKVYMPDAEAHARYNGRFEEYGKLYPLMKKICV